jgi:hypothetical protein
MPSPAGEKEAGVVDRSAPDPISKAGSNPPGTTPFGNPVVSNADPNRSPAPGTTSPAVDAKPFVGTKLPGPNKDSGVGIPPLEPQSADGMPDVPVP